MGFQKFSKPQENQKRSFREVWVVAILLTVVALVVWLIDQTFSVRDVKVSFFESICEDEQAIREDLALGGKNIFFVNEAAARSKILEKNLCVKDLKLERFFPSTVEILVKGRVAIAALVEEVREGELLDLSVVESSASTGAALLDFSKPASLGEKYLLSRDGVVFLKTDGEVNLPTMYFAGNLELKQRLEPKLIEAVSLSLDKMQGQIDIDFMRINAAGNLITIEEDGRRTILALKGDVLKQLASLQLLWQKNRIESRRIESIDLRFSEPVVVYSK